MSKATPLFNNFVLGEISDRMMARTDLSTYFGGLSINENYIPLPQGGLEFRPGTYYVANGKTAGERIRLIPYERGTAQNYIIELGNQYARFYTNGARIESGGSPVEIATPWTTAQLFELKFAQDDDELYIVHRSHAPRVIKRTTDDLTWTITTKSWTPFNSADNYPGAIAFWQGRLCLFSTNNEPQTAWGSYVGDYDTWSTWSFEIGSAASPSDFAPGATLTGGSSGATCVVVAKITSLLYVVKSLSGSFQYNESISDGTNTAAATAGYPVVTPATGPSDPWKFKIASDRAVTIQWAVSGPDLIVGTSAGEWIFTGGDSPFYAENFLLKRQVKWGSSRVQGVLFGDRCLYVPKLGNELREMYFTYERNGYVAPNMTIWASHMLTAGVDEMEVQESPSPVLWIVSTDGVLVAFAYDPTVGMMSWGRMVTEQAVESVAVISGTGEDQVWLSLVQGTARHICYMKARDWGGDQRDVFFVDDGLTIDYGIAHAITGATKTDPIQITCTAHPFSNDQHVKIVDVEGMTQLNDKIYTVKNAAANTFDLYTEDGSDGIDGTFFTLELANAPSPNDFPAGATLTGSGSGATCEVFRKESDKMYLCRNRSGTFSDGENISDGTNNASGAAGYPVVTDSYGTYTSGGTAQRFEKSASGFAHLEGEELEVVADGANHPRRTVSSGAISLQVWANRIQAGLPYTGKMRLMRLNAGGQSGPAIGKVKKVTKAIVGFYRSLGGKIGPSTDKLTEFEWRLPGYPMDQVPPIFTGFKEISVQDTWNKDGWLMMVQDQPQPQTIVSIMPFVETKE